jgi:hypothetical protein
MADRGSAEWKIASRAGGHRPPLSALADVAPWKSQARQFRAADLCYPGCCAEAALNAVGSETWAR